MSREPVGKALELSIRDKAARYTLLPEEQREVKLTRQRSLQDIRDHLGSSPRLGMGGRIFLNLSFGRYFHSGMVS